MRRWIPIVALAFVLSALWPAAPALAADDDIPGTALAVGGHVLGTVDAADPNDVYGVDLVAGQEVYIRCDPGNTYTGEGNINLIVPGASSIAERALYNEISIQTYGGIPWQTKHGGYFYYLPAKTGTYYLWVEQTAATLDYDLSVARSSRAALSLAGDADDVPGTAAGPGTVTGVVSTLADHYDVYALTLTAGQSADIQLVPLTPYDNFYESLARVSLLDPETIAVGEHADHVVAGPREAINAQAQAGRQTGALTYAVPRSGIYYVLVEAGPFVEAGAEGWDGMDFGYQLVVSVTGSSSGGGFSDVHGSPYETAIADLSGRGVIAGYEDGTFRPAAPVTRQQFAKMIVKTLGYAVTGTEVCPFRDVVVQTGTDPFYPSKYVAVCALRAITSGKTATTFAPADNITRQQLITMVVRAAALSDPAAGYTPPFSAAQFSLTEHYQNARKAAYAGLLDGLQGVGSSYSFGAGSSRGECAQLLYNLLNHSTAD